MRLKPTETKSILRRVRRWPLLVAYAIKQIWLLPNTIAAALRQRRRHAALAAAEAERLDRIRNPSDYLGK
jgi:hypothetical protein